MNLDVMDLSRAVRLDRSAISLGLLSELLEYLLGEDPVAPKPGSFAHQGEQQVFSLLCNDTHPAQIYDKLAALAIQGDVFTCISQLVGPGCNQLALQNQLKFVLTFDDRNFQHLASALGALTACSMPNVMGI